jgi:hypothetical protein
MGQECCRKKQKCIYNSIIKSITTYICKVWQIKDKIKNIGFGSLLLAHITKEHLDREG